MLTRPLSLRQQSTAGVLAANGSFDLFAGHVWLGLCEAQSSDGMHVTHSLQFIEGMYQ